MQKAILLGNGFSSQLITKYKDEALLQNIHDNLIMRPIYERYRVLFSEFSNCINQIDIIKRLEKLGFPDPLHTYDIYFDRYRLDGYIGKENICGIETLLKIGQLFGEIQKTTIDEMRAIRAFAASYYWNCGLNGIAGINNPKFNVTRFRDFLNIYEFVYTTNYDTILDDAYDGTVAHLHGSFLIDKDGCIRTGKVNEADSLIIWGKDDEEKIQQIDKASGMHKLNQGFRFNVSKFNTVSVLDRYFDSLHDGAFSELDIVGYSGENDRHINLELCKNSVLKRINYFCSPKDTGSKNKKQSISKMFCDKFFVNLICWDEFWRCFMSDL